ncbi:hypothetical protein UO65_1216 [Actinokineospora spheciospongiae]|uniref:Uncharacterized protein n=1 Tax=Actinokineospora spheciospongiae TaxID=909613 RepID=W7JBY1_9PSEU|nr:hypothetical protein UO65_1216 [Actinokineospora spheciospongiae]
MAAALATVNAAVKGAVVPNILALGKGRAESGQRKGAV